METSSQNKILGWFILFTLTLSTSNSIEARQLQNQSSSISNSEQSNQFKPIIKVEEFRYLEKKLVQRNVDRSILDLFFGSERQGTTSSAISSRSNRILLPQMIGGLPALFAHIEYPNQAKAKGVEGIVKVEFTVTELGMVEDIEIIEGIGSGCDEEVIKALERTRFSPAVQNGRFVKVKLSQSILFELKSLRR